MEEKDIKVGTKLHFASGASATIIYMTDDGYYSMLEYDYGWKDILCTDTIYQFEKDGKLTIE